MKKVCATLATLILFAAGSGQTLPRVDDTDVNASLAAVIQAYGQRSLVAAELLDLERRGARGNARLLATVLDANARVAVLQENPSALCRREEMKRFETAQHRLEAALSRLLLASDHDRDMAGNSRYRALKARLRSIERQIAAARQHYDDIVSYYNARLSMPPLRFVPSALMPRQRPVFAELEQPPLPPTRLHKTVLKGLHV
ncbi:LemA family protein [Paraburkholderia heleia]|uniref:LemA family protein n=1 Tax=Paraburkholderia heleia TaxID=634127 RepID=UPI0031DB7E16